MLGQSIDDPDGIEGPADVTPGLGFLDITTTMQADKRLARVSGRHAATGLPISGYEIHIGQSDGPDRARPFALIDGQPEGACSPDGRVTGSYLHGLFGDDAFRAAWLRGLGLAPSGQSYGKVVDDVLDRLAAHLETHLDVSALLALAR